jgi:hypothetical protein
VSLPKIERDPEFGPDEFKIPSEARDRGVHRAPVFLQEFWSLPLYACSGTSQSVGCAKNPFAIRDGP